MKQKKIVSLFAVFGLLIGIAPYHADAAGAMRFDFENAGVSQENQYTLDDGKWDLTYTKTYEYYSDGTLKTVCSEHEYLSYEGHYDPHGNLMDPTYTFFAGYVEGILLDSNAKPVRRYDGKGRLTHFEALGLDFDGEAPFLVKTDYEYDSQNRVSRVVYEYEYLDKYYVSYGYTDISNGHVFHYAADGSYTISCESRGDSGEISRTSFSYDTEHRLMRYDSSYESIYDDELYSETETHLYYYDRDGFLSKSLVYFNGNEIPEKSEYHYRKKNNSTILCDVYELNYDSKKMECKYTVTYTYDNAKRLVKEDGLQEMKYSYKIS